MENKKLHELSGRRTALYCRITPMINWYMSRVMRTEFMYGYGVLDRYNLKGGLQIFQVRLQLTVM